MTTVAQLVDFRRDLFFDGAVQIAWFNTDHERRNQAASHFIFHGPDYHGVAADELSGVSNSPLIDTASLVQTMAAGTEQSSRFASLPIALVIAGYGTGKSHLGLTLATLFSNPTSDVATEIIYNIEQAAPGIGERVKGIIRSDDRPSLVLAINGMGDFDLAGELSRQALSRLRDFKLDTAPIEELWPRFQVAETFVSRNIELREKEFAARFGENCDHDAIIQKLKDHDENTYARVAEIFEQANGYPIRSIGQESPQQLIQTLCDTFVSDTGPFKNLMIIFDEFGRYLEFAVERPYIAGDAALQQLFEAVQDNSARCMMMCLVQYELKAYVSRVSHEKRNSINRYIGRYDAAQKFFLSTNLETLFAHLIEKKDSQAIKTLVTAHADEFNFYFETLHRWFPSGEFSKVWADPTLFNKVIVEGCWPLNPLATWFLCRLKDQFQHRSAVAFVADAIERAGEKTLNENGKPWTISAVDLCSDALIEELIATEETQGGAIAHSLKAALKRYESDLIRQEKRILLGALVAYKIGLKLKTEQEAIQSLALLTDMGAATTQKAVEELKTEYGVLEWNQRFERYEIIGDAIPRSAFVSYLKKKVAAVRTDEVDDIFAAHGKKWTEQEDIDPRFAVAKGISTTEWRYEVAFCHCGQLEKVTENKIREAMSAVRVDDFRGHLIMVYVPPESIIEPVRANIQAVIDDKLQQLTRGVPLPIGFLLLYDSEGRLKRLLSESWVLNAGSEDEEAARFRHFIDDAKMQIQEELKLAFENLLMNREYIFPSGLNPKVGRLQKVGYALFDLIYPKVVPFPFDGFSTAKGNAAKDSREIAVELFKGTVDQDWIASRPPQMQNRILSLFRKWGATSASNEIAWYPQNKIVREIITNIENQLKNEGVINLGSVFDLLVAPPYGCNIASACLLLALFVSARKNATAITYVGQDVSASVWTSNAFKGNFISPEALKTTTVRYVSETEASEWDQLLAQWDAEQTYLGQAAFLNDAEELKVRVPLPQGILAERYQRLYDRTQLALGELAQYERFLNDQVIYFERGLKGKNVNNLSRVGKSLVDRLRQLENQKNQWTDELTEPLKKLCNEARQAVAQLFDDWLPLQTCLNVRQLDTFQSQLRYVEKNLEALELEEQKDALREHVESIAQRIEQLDKLRHIDSETDAFVAARTITEKTSISQLKLWKDERKGILETLSQYNQFIEGRELNQIRNKIDEFKSLCEDQIHRTKAKLEKLWNKEFERVDDIQNTTTEIYELQPLFSGESVDSSDLLQMLDQIIVFQRDLAIWQDMSLPANQLNNLFDQRLKEAEEIMDGDDPPPWDPEPIYRMLYNYVLSQRKMASDQWFDGLFVEPKVAAKMPLEDCQRLLNRIKNVPEYIDNDQRNKVGKLAEALENRLSTLEVEGLLVRFRALSEKLRRQFLELAAKEI
jgi:hypothetical protein